MAVKIRLSRGGSKKRPFYHVVAADSRAPRDGKFIEKLGTYNPMLPKENENRFSFNEERVKYWLSKGAQPTDRLHKLLALAGLMSAPVIRESTIKSQPKAKAVEMAQKKAEKAAAKLEAAKQAQEEASAPAQEEASAE